MDIQRRDRLGGGLTGGFGEVGFAVNKRGGRAGYTSEFGIVPMAAVEPALDSIQVQEAGAEMELSARFLYYMFLQREVEDRIERKLYRQGKILGGVYVGRGQEAI